MPCGTANQEPTSADGSQMFPPLTRQDVLNCMFSSWYEKLSRVTFKSVIIKPLEPSFIEYLASDGIVLPEDEEAPKYRNNIKDDSSDDGSGWSDDEEDLEDQSKPLKTIVNIDATSMAIREAIDKLGGKVFPRMNWSAPTDATWMTCDNSLQCRSLSEVLIVLKGSDKISEDIDGTQFLSKQEMGDWEHELVLRQWCNLYPSMEFRCFVRNKTLVAVSQIEMQYYEFLESMEDKIESSIQRLFDRHICSQFESENYCFDVYITQEDGRTFVIDFKPMCDKVDSCLYLWQEILAVKEDESLGLRLFPDSLDGMRHYSNKFSRSQFPKDLDGEGLNTSITEFIKKMTLKQAAEEDEQSE
ncbi:hypothetical protein LPJ57_000849 [Coemansia sp. RSA 486]|nr:hypothetical protein LPJ57_000849 [Coemansia sp. RSA 486]KAJ2600689.1 hypothetical protein GGF39_001655 [Coemansia sp. RSA 1721]KAJ2637495.1 hypothetical protein GGF40_002325 [Coemansia sp. RSA 1286]